MPLKKGTFLRTCPQSYRTVSRKMYAVLENKVKPTLSGRSFLLSDQMRKIKEIKLQHEKEGNRRNWEW